MSTGSGLGRRSVAAASLLSGCGYSLSGRGAFLPAHIKIIGVPIFVNSTPVFEIEQKITAKVQAELIGRGRYKVKPDRAGRRRRPARRDPRRSPWRRRRSTSSSRRRATPSRSSPRSSFAISRRTRCSGRIRRWRSPSSTTSRRRRRRTDPNAFLGQNVNALERLASEFARTIVSAILEVVLGSAAATPAAVRKQIAAGKPDPLYLIVGDDEAEMSQSGGGSVGHRRGRAAGVQPRTHLRDRQDVDRRRRSSRPRASCR